MSDLTLPPDLSEALARAAKRARTTPANLASRAIRSYLEEMADAKAVKSALAQRGKLVPWREVKRRHGLDG
jgi:predicted transcriptional regulator